MTQDQEIKKIPLEVGKTQIGSMMGKFKGEVYNFQIYYGNYILPSPHGEFIHYNQNLYKQKLMKFLDSEEGQKYIRPTEKEIEEATQLVISKESQLISKQPKDTVEKVQEEAEQAPKEEVVQPFIKTEADELETINLKKKVKAMLIVMIIQSLCIVALIGLRVFGL